VPSASPTSAASGRRRELAGVAAVLLSATGFGTLAVFVKLGYAAGLSMEQMLAYRFLLAGLGMSALSIAAGQGPWRLPRGRLAALAAMGVAGYAGQSFSFFLALRSLPASLVELVLYVYPSLVALGAWAFRGQRVSRLHGAALLASFAGLALLLQGAAPASAPSLLVALVPPLAYSAYILLGDRVMPGLPALGASTVTILGATLTFGLAAAFAGRLAPPGSPRGWLVLAGLALLPTMLAIPLFLAALPRIGASRAALLSTWEPVVTVSLAVALLGDRLRPLQLAGAALVLAAVLSLQWPRGRAAPLTAEPELR
jgi:drug/metabolite transporter (DMT)-like permease